MDMGKYRSGRSVVAAGLGAVALTMVVGLAAGCGTQGPQEPATSTTTTTPAATVSSPAPSTPPPADHKIDPRGGNKFEPGTHATPGQAPRHRHWPGEAGGEGDGGDGGGDGGGGGGE